MLIPKSIHVFWLKIKLLIWPSRRPAASYVNITIVATVYVLKIVIYDKRGARGRVQFMADQAFPMTINIPRATTVDADCLIYTFNKKKPLQGVFQFEKLRWRFCILMEWNQVGWITKVKFRFLGFGKQKGIIIWHFLCLMKWSMQAFFIFFSGTNWNHLMWT